jgi:hypothetical protein
MTQKKLFLANELSPKFAIIGLEGPTKLKNMAILPKTLSAINDLHSIPTLQCFSFAKSFHLMMIRSAKKIHL